MHGASSRPPCSRCNNSRTISAPASATLADDGARLVILRLASPLTFRNFHARRLFVDAGHSLAPVRPRSWCSFLATGKENRREAAGGSTRWPDGENGHECWLLANCLELVPTDALRLMLAIIFAPSALKLIGGYSRSQGVPARLSLAGPCGEICVSWVNVLGIFDCFAGLVMLNWQEIYMRHCGGRSAFWFGLMIHRSRIGPTAK